MTEIEKALGAALATMLQARTMIALPLSRPCAADPSCALCHGTGLPHDSQWLCPCVRSVHYGKRRKPQE